MKKNDKKVLIIIFMISLPIILSLIWNECVLKLDISSKCFSEQIKKGFLEGINKYAENQSEKMNDNLEELENNLNKTLSQTGNIK